MKLYDSLFGNAGKLRRSRRRSIRRWKKKGTASWCMNQETASWNMDQETESGWERGKKKRRVRLMLLTGAALEILWMAGSAGGGLSVKDVDQVQWIGEDISTGTVPSRTEKTGVSIRMDDGTIRIFKVNEHLEGGSD